MKDLQDAIDSEFSSKAYVKVKLEIPTKNQQYFEPVVSPTIKSVEQLYEMLKKVSFEQKMYHPASYKII